MSGHLSRNIYLKDPMKANRRDVLITSFVSSYTWISVHLPNYSYHFALTMATFDRSILAYVPSLEAAHALVANNPKFDSFLSEFQTVAAQHQMTYMESRLFTATPRLPQTTGSWISSKPSRLSLCMIRLKTFMDIRFALRAWPFTRASGNLTNTSSELPTTPRTPPSWPESRR